MVVSDRYNAVVLLGATATGKTALGVSLAREFSGEIVSADSRQVYKGLDIGSGKDLGEYGNVPYHLIDITDLSAEYSVFDFQRDFRDAFDAVKAREALPVVVGGTGMYLDSIIREYEFIEVPENPDLRAELSSLSMDGLANRLISLKGEVHNKTDLEDRQRLVRAIEIAEGRKDHSGFQAHRGGKSDFRPLVLGVRYPRDELRSRIKDRLFARLDEGLVEEVARLHEAGASWERLERLGLEYRITSEYLEGKIPSREEYSCSLLMAICRFAKRQETWFRGMERKGVPILWLDRGDRDEALRAVSRIFA